MIGKRALVVFEDRTDLAWLHLLARGFRHCFCLIGEGEAWTLLDPLKDRIEVLSLAGLREAELASGFRASGCEVLAGTIGPRGPGVLSLVRPFTCVEVVKRALHLPAPRVLTPLQLHRALRRDAGFRSA